MTTQGTGGNMRAAVAVVLAVLLWPVGLALSIWQMRRTKGTTGTARGLAIAGVVLAVIIGAVTSWQFGNAAVDARYTVAGDRELAAAMEETLVEKMDRLAQREAFDVEFSPDALSSETVTVLDAYGTVNTEESFAPYEYVLTARNDGTKDAWIDLRAVMTDTEGASGEAYALSYPATLAPGQVGTFVLTPFFTEQRIASIDDVTVQVIDPAGEGNFWSYFWTYVGVPA